MSLISNDFLGQEVILKPTNRKLIGVTGGEIQIKGVLERELVSFGSVKIHHDFFVVKDIVEMVVLGVDFMTAQRLTLDYGKKVVKLMNHEIRIHEEKIKEKIQLVSGSRKAIKGVALVKVQAKYENNKNKKVTEGYYTYIPDPELWGEQEPIMIKVENNLVMPVITIGDMEASIQSGTVFGNLEPITAILVNKEGQGVTKDTNKLEEVMKLLKIQENEYLTSSQKIEVKKLLQKYLHIFSLSRLDMSVTNLTEHAIPLKHDAPVVVPYRNVPLHLLKACEKEINTLLENGAIRPSTSKFSAPVVIVKKKEPGVIRLCIDYRALNKVSIRNMAPLPSLNVVTALWAGCKYYSNLDFRSAYHQIKIKEEDKHKTGFSIPSIGHFEWNLMCEGLSSCPATYQSLLDQLLRGCKSNIASCFVDDIISASMTFEKMVQNLDEIFSRIEKALLKLNPAKCDLFQQKIKFLGSFISEKGIAPDPDKISAITDMCLPKTKRELQSFIGGCGWFRKSTKNMAEAIKGLTEALKIEKGQKFKLDDNAKKSFEEVKKLITSAEVMTLPRLDRDFVVYTDASLESIAGMIAQKVDGVMRPIEYGSRILQPAERNYPSFQREFLAIKWFIEKWRFYLIARKFEVISDMQAISSAKFMKKTQSTTLFRWCLALSEYEFTVSHVAGKDLGLVDSMSRLPKVSDDLFTWWNQKARKVLGQNELISLVGIECQGGKDIQGDGTYEFPEEVIKDEEGIFLTAQSSDKVIKEVKGWLLDELPPNKKASEALTMMKKKYRNKYPLLQLDKQGLLRRKYLDTKTQKWRWLICVPDSEQEKLMDSFHRMPTSGHYGEDKMIKMLLKSYWFPDINQLLKMYVARCENCYWVNIQNGKKPKFGLQSFPDYCPNNYLCIDLIGPIRGSKSKGYLWILTCVDKASRFVAAVPLKDATSTTIAQALLNNWFYIHGVPRKLLSDRGANLDVSIIMKDLYNVLGITKVRSTPYHARTNGAVERVNKELKYKLSKLVAKEPHRWPEFLKAVVFAINTMEHKSTGFTPFFLFHGHESNKCHDLIYGTTTTKFYENEGHLGMTLYNNIKQAFDMVYENNSKALVMMKRSYDKNKNEVEYSVKDYVAVWKPLTSAVKEYRKFKNEFTGPYVITKTLTDYLFEVKNMKTGNLQVVHHDALRRYRKDMTYRELREEDKQSRSLKKRVREDSSSEEEEEEEESYPEEEVRTSKRRKHETFSTTSEEPRSLTFDNAREGKDSSQQVNKDSSLTYNKDKEQEQDQDLATQKSKACEDFNDHGSGPSGMQDEETKEGFNMYIHPTRRTDPGEEREVKIKALDETQVVIKETSEKERTEGSGDERKIIDEVTPRTPPRPKKAKSRALKKLEIEGKLGPIVTHRTRGGVREATPANLRAMSITNPILEEEEDIESGQKTPAEKYVLVDKFSDGQLSRERMNRVLDNDERKQQYEKIRADIVKKKLKRLSWYTQSQQ